MPPALKTETVEAIGRWEGRYALGCGCFLLLEVGHVNPKSSKQHCRQHDWQPVTGIRVNHQTVSSLLYRQTRYELTRPSPETRRTFYTDTMKAIDQFINDAMIAAVGTKHAADAAHLLWERAYYPGNEHTNEVLAAVAEINPRRSAHIQELLERAEQGNISPKAWYAAYGARAIWQHTDYDQHQSNTNKQGASK